MTIPAAVLLCKKLRADYHDLELLRNIDFPITKVGGGDWRKQYCPFILHLCIIQEKSFLRCSCEVLVVLGKEFQMNIIIRVKTNNDIATAGKVPN